MLCPNSGVSATGSMAILSMKKPCIVLIAAVALPLLLLSGCATVTRGTKDTLVVESDPAGADVRLSTGQTGKTPTSFKLSRKDTVLVTISREGYETVNVTVNSQVVGSGAAGMAGNVLVGGLIGVGVDAWSGATKSLKPNPVTVKLVRLDPQPQHARDPENKAVSGEPPKQTDVAAAKPASEPETGGANPSAAATSSGSTQ